MPQEEEILIGSKVRVLANRAEAWVHGRIEHIAHDTELILNSRELGAEDVIVPVWEVVLIHGPPEADAST